MQSSFARGSLRAVATVIAFLAAACTGSPASTNGDAAIDIDGSPSHVLTGDIAVFANSVVAHARLIGLPCTCSNDWPAVGACAPTIDQQVCDCGDTPLPCLTGARLERDGVVVTDSVVRDVFYGAFMLRADMSEAAELVLTGCGEEIRVPVQAQPHDAPSFTDFCMDQGALSASWNPVSANGIAMLSHRWFVGTQCRSSDSGSLALDFADDTYRLGLEVQHPDGTVTTPNSGAFQMWQVTEVAGGERFIYAPNDLGGGRYSLPPGMNSTARITFQIDGVEDSTQPLFIQEGSIALDGSDPNDTIILNGRTSSAPFRLLWFQASATTDTIDVEIDGTTYSATVPHVAPTAGITLTPAGEEVYVLTLAPTIFTAPVGGATREIGFEITYEVGYLALPCD